MKFFIVSLMMVVSVLAKPSPTYAASNIPCLHFQVCTYQGWDFTGSMYYYTGPIEQCKAIGSPWTDQISSVINNSDYRVRIYAGSGCNLPPYPVSDSLLIEPGGSVSTLTWPLNNHVWSIYIGKFPPW